MARKRAPKLVSFRPDRERAKAVEVALYEACEDALERLGDRIAGFVLVPWDVTGDGFAAIHVESGPVGHALLPTYVKDTVNRQLAIDASVEDEGADSGTG